MASLRWYTVATGTVETVWQDNLPYDGGHALIAFEVLCNDLLPILLVLSLV